MGFYENLQNTATTLLRRYGQQIDFTRANTGAYNTATGTRDDAPDVEFQGFGAAFDYSQSQYDGNNIIIGDMRLLLEKVTPAPEIGDRFTMKGKVYSILRVTPLSPAGIDVLYECQVRAGNRGGTRNI